MKKVQGSGWSQEKTDAGTRLWFCMAHSKAGLLRRSLLLALRCSRRGGRLATSQQKGAQNALYSVETEGDEFF